MLFFTSVTKQTSRQQLFSVSLECTVRELAEIIRENYEKFHLHLSYRELQMAGEGIFLNRHLTRENYRRKLPLFLSWCPMQKRVCIVSIQKWGSMDAFSICVVAKWQIWRTTLSSHKHSIPVAHTHIRAVIASCCVVDVCVCMQSAENESCAPQPTRHEAGEPGGHLGGPLTRDQTHLRQREHAKEEIHGTLHVSTFILSVSGGFVSTSVQLLINPQKRFWNPARILLEHQTSIENISGLNPSWIPEFILWIYFSLSPQKHHYSWAPTVVYNQEHVYKNGRLE